MRRVVSVAPPSTSRRLTAVFVVLSLLLVWIGLAFSIEVFGRANPVVLGLNVGLGFAILAGLVVLYYRLFHSHRIVIEHDEDLW